MIMKIAAQKAKEKKILEARELTFEAGRKILDSIDWTVYKGQRWVLLGANGAGKTSLLSTICAYNTPSSGDKILDLQLAENARKNCARGKPGQAED